MGRLLSDLFDGFLETTNFSWPAKIALSIVVGGILMWILGSWY